jgi:hypothetical protein
VGRNHHPFGVILGSCGRWPVSRALARGGAGLTWLTRRR